MGSAESLGLEESCDFLACIVGFVGCVVVYPGCVSANDCEKGGRARSSCRLMIPIGGTCDMALSVG